MNNKKLIYFGILLLNVIVISVFCVSYALFTNKIEQKGKLNIVAGTLDYKITGDNIQNNKVLVVGNTTTELKLKITSLNKIDSKYELYYNSNDLVEVGYISDSPKGVIEKQKDKEITLYVRNNTSKSQEVTFGVESEFLKNEVVVTKGKKIINFNLYKESILNGTDPVLTNNLIPVIINEDGTVKKADITNKWYSYSEKKWANAVVLKDGFGIEEDGSIKEESIESYFVWIPKYSYQLWDLGNYNSITGIDNSKPHAISIRFGTVNTSDSVDLECTTPITSGESGNCKVGDYMTHPAFLTFNTNGLWVGKFQTGYDGAENTSAAQVNSSTKEDINKLIIKPNQYIWSNISIGNAFRTSYQYLRNEESHLMKNTEWGSVAYLTNSNYGRCTNNICSEVRINNNANNITGYAATEEPTLGYNNKISIEGNRVEETSLGKDGIYTVNYLNGNSVVASTTGNYSGIYDMNGGSWDYVAGYMPTDDYTNMGLIPTDYDDKYFDVYLLDSNQERNNRILGDAVGEMGPFENIVTVVGVKSISSWYKDHSPFVFLKSKGYWFTRGNCWYNGTSSGIFSYTNQNGSGLSGVSFRIVLAP